MSQTILDFKKKPLIIHDHPKQEESSTTLSVLETYEIQPCPVCRYHSSYGIGIRRGVFKGVEDGCRPPVQGLPCLALLHLFQGWPAHKVGGLWLSFIPLDTPVVTPHHTPMMAAILRQIVERLLISTKTEASAFGLNFSILGPDLYSSFSSQSVGAW
jgi:hypothetical protein